jgi:hypothetical protein
VEAIADTFPEPYGPQLITDLVTHEHDIRGALGVHGARESDAVRVGADFVVRWGFTLGIAARGLPAVAVRAKGKEWTAGDGDPPVTLEASEFEVLRALTGRRTVDQIRALRWSDDPAPYLPVFTYGPFTLPAQPLAD